jgi:hypothetical protein
VIWFATGAQGSHAGQYGRGDFAVGHWRQAESLALVADLDDMTDSGRGSGAEAFP